MKIQWPNQSASNWKKCPERSISRELQHFYIWTQRSSLPWKSPFSGRIQLALVPSTVSSSSTQMEILKTSNSASVESGEPRPFPINLIADLFIKPVYLRDTVRRQLEDHDGPYVRRWRPRIRHETQLAHGHHLQRRFQRPQTTRLRYSCRRKEQQEHDGQLEHGSVRRRYKT